MTRFTAGTALLILCGALVSTSTAKADWSGGIEAGTQLGSGENPALRFFARHQGNPLSQYLYLDWIRESGSSSYRLGYNPTFNISQSIFSFGEFSLEQDDPGGVAREIDARVGIGNHLFRTKNSRFTVHTGIGGTKVEFVDSENDTSEGFFFAGGLFTSKLIGLLRFDANIEATAGESQTTTRGEAGISFRIGPNTALKYAYSYRRFDFDTGQDDIVDEDSFLTVTYGF